MNISDPPKEKNNSANGNSAPSKQMYRILFDSLDEGVLIVKFLTGDDRKVKDAEIIYANESLQNHTGFKREDLLFRKASEILVSISETWFNRFNQIIKGKPLHFEEYSHAMNKWLEIRSVPMEEKNTYGIYLKDITLKKYDQQLLSERPETSPAGSLNGVAHCRIIVDEYGKPYDYTILRVNDSYTKILGVERNDIEGKRVREVFPGIENFSFNYIAEYGKVALEGKELYAHAYFEITGQYLSIYAFSFEPGEFTVVFTDITATKQTEISYRHQTELLQTILNSIPVFITIYNPDATSIIVNKELEKITGWTNEDFHNDNPIEMLYSDSQQKKKDDGFLQEWSGWRDFVITGKNGIKIESSWAKISLPDGRLVGIGIDIRERIEAEKALKENQKLLQSTMDNFPTVIVFKDREGKFLNVNKVVESVLGMSKEKIIGLTDYDLFNKEDADNYRKHDIQVMESRKPLEREEVTLINGKKIYHIDISFPLIDSDGGVYGVGHISHDISEIKKAEEALRKKEEILMLILDHINEGIIVAEAPDGKVVAVSKWGINHTAGRSLDSVIDLPIQHYLDQWDVRDIKTGEKIGFERLPIARAMKGESINGEEWVMVRPDNSRFIVSVNAVPIYDEDETSIKNTVATWTDISIKKKNEEALQESELRYRTLANNLQQANEVIKNSLREKEFLMKEIHHRVKNNLQIIASLLHLQSDTLENDDFKKVFIEGANRIKTIAMVHEKLYTENLEVVRSIDYIPDLVKLIKNTFKMDHLTIEIDLNIENIDLNIDNAVPMGLLINEIMSNSFKHAFHERTSGRIMVSLKAVSDDINELVISDNGRGFPVDFVKNGLGMALIENLVAQLDGEAEIRKSPGVEYKIKFKKF